MTTDNENDPFYFKRFLHAQETTYLSVLEELRRGDKETHWMWFIFPQIAGLGESEKDTHYSIKTLEEARAYLNHPILGQRLLECTRLILKIENAPAESIFGYSDSLKLQSSMTLFESASDPVPCIQRPLIYFLMG